MLVVGFFCLVDSLRVKWLRDKVDVTLSNKQRKKDEFFELEDRIVITQHKSLGLLGVPVLSDEDYRNKYYGDD